MAILQQLQQRFYQWFHAIAAELNRYWISWSILGLAFVLGCVTIYHGQFVDEADNLVLGSQILRGEHLYKDLFSHHFPFAYYWSAFVIAIAGKSIFFTRLSVWIFQIGSIALAMRVSGFRFALALTALIWSILRPIYRGNFVLYSAFSSVALLFLFAIIVSILVGKSKPRRSVSIAIGIYAALAILSDPLSVYPVGIGLLALILRDTRQGLLAGGTMLGGGLLYGFYLTATQSINEFWEQAVLFNAQVYSHYHFSNPNRLRLFGEMLIKGMDITNPVWWTFDPFKPITMIYTQFDQWAFTGLFFRLVVFLSVVILAVKKFWAAAVFIYLYIGSVLVINPGDFRGTPFVLCAVFLVCGMISGDWLAEDGSRTIHYTRIILSILLSLIVTWVLFTSINYYAQSRGLLRPEPHFQSMVAEAKRIKAFTCDIPGVSLAHYPGGIYLHWFTGLPPATRYVYLWPWVAQVGMEEVIRDLDREDKLAIVVRYDDVIWERYSTRDYLRPLDEFLARRYVPVREGIFQSPALAAKCPN
jgi:hypothetical protein